MIVNTGQYQPQHERNMLFNSIASRYDLMNRIISLGKDQRWRRTLASQLGDMRDHVVLDVATGTGDQLLCLQNISNPAHLVGMDPSPDMIAHCRKKVRSLGRHHDITLCSGDVHQLPFADNVFDAVTVSFGIRNFHDRDASLREMYRVLVPGGRILILELTVPANYPARFCHGLHSRWFIPLLGGLIARNLNAYRYLNNSIAAFPSPAVFREMMDNAGFLTYDPRSLTLGAATLFEGCKPSA